MSLTSFLTQGNTLIVASTAAAATAAVQPSTGSIQGMRIVNLSTNDAYVAFGTSTATASVPTTASPSTGHQPILQRSERTFNTPPNVWVSAITTAGQANLAFTPGFGQ
jgi:hypothetical protein